MKKASLTTALLIGASAAILSTGAVAGPNSQFLRQHRLKFRLKFKGG